MKALRSKSLFNEIETLYDEVIDFIFIYIGFFFFNCLYLFFTSVMIKKMKMVNPLPGLT